MGHTPASLWLYSVLWPQNTRAYFPSYLRQVPLVAGTNSSGPRSPSKHSKLTVRNSELDTWSGRRERERPKPVIGTDRAARRPLIASGAPRAVNYSLARGHNGILFSTVEVWDFLGEKVGPESPLLPSHGYLRTFNLLLLLRNSGSLQLFCTPGMIQLNRVCVTQYGTNIVHNVCVGRYIIVPG